jgi:hypothetical protein
MTKVALELPAVIVTLGGKVAFVELLESFTTKPPAGAGPVRLTDPVDEAPPLSIVGLRLTDCRMGGITVRVAAWDPDAKVAVITELLCVATALVDTVKVTLI